MPKTRCRFFLPVLLAALFFLCASLPAKAETPVFGTIDSDTVFTVSESPYHVVGSLTVGGGVTLTVEAGVTLLFDSGTALVVNGNLDARASETNPIIFTHSDSGTWVGITLNSSDGSLLDHIKVSHATNGLSLYTCAPQLGVLEFLDNSTGLYLNSSSPEISDCLFSGNYHGLYLSQSSSFIHDSHFINNTHAIYAGGTGTPRIENNCISGSGNWAIYYNNGVISLYDTLVVRNNIISGGVNGIYATFTSDTMARDISYNTLVDNSGYGIYASGSAGYANSATIIGNIVVGNNIGFFSNSTLSLDMGYNNFHANDVLYDGIPAPLTDRSDDPLFDYEPAYNFRLGTDSPCRNMGPDHGEIGAYGNAGAPPTYNTSWQPTITTAGQLPGNERWSGTVEINETVTVPAGYLLLIEPGTELLFAPGAGLTVEGRIIAEGSATYPINMDRQSDSGSWGSLVLNGASNTMSHLSYLSFHHASTGLTLDNCAPELTALEFLITTNVQHIFM